MNEMNEQNLIQIGTVSEVHPEQSLVKVHVLGKPSGWLPVLQQVNGFKKQFIALCVDEQVMVLAQRYVVRGVYNQGCREPAGSGTGMDIIEYEDGTRLEYNSQAKTLSIEAVGAVRVAAKETQIRITQNLQMNATQIEVQATGKVQVSAPEIALEATGSIQLNAPQIALNGNATIAGTLATSGGVSVSGIDFASHVHPQNNGNDNGGGVNTGGAQ